MFLIAQTFTFLLNFYGCSCVVVSSFAVYSLGPFVLLLLLEVKLIISRGLNFFFMFHRFLWGVKLVNRAPSVVCRELITLPMAPSWVAHPTLILGIGQRLPRNMIQTDVHEVLVL